MPLDGIVCTSARNIARGIEEILTPEACLAHAATRDNDCGMTYELLRQIFSKQTRSMTGEFSHISTTKLTSRCMRRVVLEQHVPYVAPPTRLYDAFRGSLAHAILEDNMRPANGKDPGSMGERRLWIEHPYEPGEFISGMPDLWDPYLGLLFDYKTKKALPGLHWRSPYPSDALQLQVNGVIIEDAKWANPANDPTGVYPPVPSKTVMGDGWKRQEYGPNPAWAEGEEVERLKPSFYGKDWRHYYIVYLDFEGSTVLEVKTSPGYKKRWVPDIWSADQVWDFIEPRYQALKEGLDDPEGHLPPIPEDLHPLGSFDKTSPCTYCDVRETCVELHMKEGR